MRPNERAMTLEEYRRKATEASRPLTDGPMRGAAGAKHNAGRGVREGATRGPSEPTEDPVSDWLTEAVDGD